MAPRNADEKESKQSYFRVYPSLARFSEDYNKVFTNAFQEQTYRIVQRTWRAKHNKKFSGKTSEILAEPSMSLGFIREARSPANAILYASKINHKKYHELDYEGHDFVRHLYKALRLNLISKHKLADVMLLHDLKKQLKAKSIQQYNFEEKGPLNLERISYATQDQLDNFQKELKNIPENERCYFSINFPKTQLLAFLFSGLTLNANQHSPYLYNSYPFFFVIFKKYIQQVKIAEERKAELINIIDNVEKEPYSVLRLLQFLVTHEKEHLLEMTMLKNFKLLFKEGSTSLNIKGKYHAIEETCNIQFLISLLRTAEEMPIMDMSPDYDPSNPDSPVICFNVFTTATFNLLQETIFGKKEVLYSFPVAGKFGPRLIYDLLVNPLKYGTDKSSRPVTIFHPDLLMEKDYHGYTSFLLATFHDRFHCWKYGASTLKQLANYLISLETNETLRHMSTTIWELSDGDFHFAYKWRYSMKVNDNEVALKEFKLSYSLLMTIILYNVPKSIKLMFLIDMIVNQNIWERLTFIHCNESVKAKIKFEDLCDSHEFDKLKALINKDIISGSVRSIKYYILVFQLRDLSRDDYLCAVKICKNLDDMGLEKILYWRSNKGLFFKECFTKDLRIEGLNSLELFDQLRKIYRNLNEEKARLSLSGRLGFFEQDLSAKSVTDKRASFCEAPRKLA